MNKSHMNIYTCTLNPSLDYKISLDKIHLGTLNRISHQSISEGGKGINVSLSLNALQIDHFAIGFLGGFSGHQIMTSLDSKPHIHQKWTMIEDTSRINVKLKETSRETEINAIGPNFNQNEIIKFKETLKEIKKGDILVLSGSVHPNYRYLYQEISKYCYLNQVKLIIDIPGEYYEDILQYRPWMIKPNLSEFKTYTKNDSHRMFDILFHIKKILDLGVSYIVLSLGRRGSILASKDKITKAKPSRVLNQISIGAGDSMVAGFIYSEINQLSHEETHQFMTYMSEQTLSNEKIEKNQPYQKIQIRNVGQSK
jgi:1-phosphofructokinase